MTAFLEDISQVTIYFKNGENPSDRVNEVALYQPLAKKPEIDESSHLLHQRKWSFDSSIPFSKKVILKIQTFFFQKIPRLISEERKTVEAKFKTVLAILLTQEILADFFLQNEKERQSFFEAIKIAAKAMDYNDFALPPNELKPANMARFLTTIASQNICLLDDTEQLNLQMASLDREERDAILFNILNNIRRSPLTSIVEVAHGSDKTEKISVTTVYGKNKVSHIDEVSGKIIYTYVENQTQATIKTNANKGVVNQHLVFNETGKDENHLLAGVSGELLSFYKVLEQTLFLLQEKGSYYFEKKSPDNVIDKEIVFTSLFSWNEYDKIVDEHFAIEKLNGKILKLVKEDGEVKYFRLSLLHQNIPFNAFNKFPAPAEIKASINDLNDKTLIILSDKILDFLPLKKLAKKYREMRNETDFIRKENALLNCVDQFNRMKDDIITHIESLPETPKHIALWTLISQKLPSGKSLHAIDMMIYFSLLVKLLNITHNINCDQATDRSAGAISIIKAQNAFIQVVDRPYLPDLSTEEERALFRVFYSMYLVFEEPELNAGLCTGFVGEKYYQNFIQKNPETTFYLIPWLKEHPEMYLGLSNYRQ